MCFHANRLVDAYGAIMFKVLDVVSFFPAVWNCTERFPILGYWHAEEMAQ